MQAQLTACVLALCATAPAMAQQGNCRSFSWSVGRPINLFDEPIPVVRDQQSLPKEGVFGVVLKPVADVIFPVAPERSDDSGRGAVITIESVPAGRFQIALSEEAWVEAMQENKRLPALPHHQRIECPGIHHSVEIETQGLPLTLMLTGARAKRINIAVVRVWPFEWRW